MGLDIRKNFYFFFLLSVRKHWNRLFREAVSALSLCVQVSLEVFKTRVEGALDKLT